MSVAFVVVLAVAAIAYIVRPLLTGPRNTAVDRGGLIDEAEERKKAAIVAILDIELESEMGKLGPEDHAALRTQYEMQALEAMRELDELGGATSPVDEALEAEIAAMRAAMTCPECGNIRPPGERCSSCGHD